MITHSRADCDPDVLAVLEREQRFLLRSLDDLDAERAAGDMADGDYIALSNSYTTRLAEVTRALDEQRAAAGEVDNRLSTVQRIVTITLVVVVAVLAGLLLARASGFRSPADSLSGDIRQSSTGLLAEADTLTREGQWPEAVETYEEVLDISPANTEALTYKGWLTAQLGDVPSGLVSLEEAIAVDDKFPDARVFRAILLDRAQRFDEAALELAALDDLEVPDEIQSLVDGSGLRASVAGGQIVERFGERGMPVDLDQIVAELDDIAQAGGVLVSLDAELAVRVFTAVLQRDGDNLVALVGKGNLLGGNADVVAADPNVGRQGLDLLDQAVALEPESAEIRLYRAFARNIQGDPDGARSDLDGIEASDLPEPLREAYDGLAADLGSE